MSDEFPKPSGDCITDRIRQNRAQAKAESLLSASNCYAFVAWTNTDLTEGRGYVVPLAICEKEATARRLGKNGSVMGCDCEVTKVEIFKHDGRWYGPIILECPTTEDDISQAKLDARHAAKAKAKAAGLTDDEIAALA